MGSDVHVYFLDVAIQGRPDLDLVASGSEEGEGVSDVAAGNDSIFIGSEGVVVFVVLVEGDSFAGKY